MKKLKVGILGSGKLVNFLSQKFFEKRNQFEVFKHEKWNHDFVEVGVLDILWICKEYKSNKELIKKIVNLIVEYNPTLCILAVPVKPFTTLKLQKTIKNLGIKTNIIYISSACPEILSDWNRYVFAFNFLIGWDSKGSLLLAKAHLIDMGISFRVIKDSFNLEICRLLINSNYLLYNYIEAQRKKIFGYYERKNRNVDRDIFQDIEFEINEGLMEIQKSNLVLPSIKSECEIMNSKFLKHLSNSFKFRFLIYSFRLFEKIKLLIKNKSELVRLKIKGRVNKYIRRNKHGKLSNSISSKSKQKEL